MRYATALTIEPTLRAGTVCRNEEQALQRVIESICSRYSPVYEHVGFVQGVYWIDASGIERVYESEYAWARALCASIAKAGYHARCVVGVTRRGTFCTALSTRGVTLFGSEAEERKSMMNTPLHTLPFEETVLLRLRHLAIENVGSFIALPAADVRSKFGERTFALHLFLSRASTVPLQPERRPVSYSRQRYFLEGIAGAEALLAAVESAFDEILADARVRRVFFQRIILTLIDEERRVRTEEIVPAEPTRSKATIFRLLAIRLETVRLETPVFGFILSGKVVADRLSQQVLFGSDGARDVRRAAEAFSIIRAEVGNDSVQVPIVRPNHDPAGRIEWKSVSAIGGRRLIGRSDGNVDYTVGTPVLCRRFFPSPVPYLSGNGTTIAGPYRIDGAWWDDEPGREYRFVRDKRRGICWIFRADASDVSYVHGIVG